MKYLIIALIISLYTTGCAQPNTKTTIEFGITNPQPGKIYKIFAEVKSDTSTSRLVNDMDYLSPDVSDLEIQLKNFRTVGDTLFGEYSFNDTTVKQYLKAGCIQVNISNLKYSAMITTSWAALDMIEPKPGGFFIRRKK
ncbi:hypothetical protein [Ignavibacterium sp.]|uniref:hypothetical protein n=1 Tax=Ignavibacterium sp. TaxID=2651167 RepID=UPI0022040255|nr:hypothetical protein [Ignavibacterium sp.]BDQ03492.1 MAG: hypothetical protein KatS3mg037_2067 [Ignavibacterium sp.]